MAERDVFFFSFQASAFSERYLGLHGIDNRAYEVTAQTLHFPVNRVLALPQCVLFWGGKKDMQDVLTSKTVYLKVSKVSFSLLTALVVLIVTMDMVFVD